MIKYKIDGNHQDLRKTRTKLVVCDDGVSLHEIIKNNHYLDYFLILPDYVKNTFKFSREKNLYYDGNRNYLAFYNLASKLKDISSIEDKSKLDSDWKFDSFNCIEYYNWFSRKNMSQLVFTSKDLDFWIDRFIREHRLIIFI